MIDVFFDKENYDFSSIKQDIALKMSFINDIQSIDFTPNPTSSLNY